MRIRCALIALAILAALSPAAAAPPAEESEPAVFSPEEEAEMEAWMKLARPGEHHAHLDRFAGSWSGEIEMWMSPEGAPTTYESSAEAAWILDGRYLEWRHTGLFAGMPFEGIGLEGYNNGEQRYEATWVDNFGTLILYYTGSCTDDGKRREVATSLTDPTDGATIHQRAVYTWIDDDRFTYESWFKKGEVEYKNMSIRYRRASP